MQKIEGYIPITPKNLQYVRYVESLQPGDSLLIPSPTPIATYLENIFRLGKSLIAPLWAPEYLHVESVESFGARLPFRVSGALAHPDLFIILAQVAYALDKQVDNWINEEAWHRVDMGMEAGLPEIYVLEMFLEQSGLEDYIELDSFHKANYRLRKRRGLELYAKRRGRRNIYISIAPEAVTG